VSDGDDFDFITAYPVHQAERKEREHVASSAPAMAWPCEGTITDGIHRVSQLLTKGVSRGEVSGGIPVIG